MFDTQFQAAMNIIKALSLSKLYPNILLINVYVNIPNSFNILSKAARFLFQKIDTYSEVIL